jgi:starch phosphorylase
MNREILLDQLKQISTEGKGTKELYGEISRVCMDEIKRDWSKKSVKNAYYLSVEFLMGRMFFNNLMELGVLNEARSIFAEKGFDLNRLEEIEDAALGNGGLGRLAACYLDSAAGIGVPLQGYGIRYRYGLFRQRFENGFQREEADDWLKWGDPWSVRRESEKREIRFADMTVTAVPYDMPIIGKRINTLRLFQAEGSAEAEKISEYLYPADDTDEGKLLRIRQEYFFSAACVRELVEEFVKVYGPRFFKFPEYHALQLNDTHAVFAAAEFLRLLTQEYKVAFGDAVKIARKTFNYTNHTILPEALECWDAELVARILPEIAMILKRLQVFASREWKAKGCLVSDQLDMSVMKSGRFAMANVAVFVSGRINGVAEIHTRIIKEKLFAVAARYYPDKFLNITNGITQRRWLMLCNEELSALYDKNFGPGWREDLDLLSLRDAFQRDADVAEFAAVKRIKKQQLAEYVRKREGIALIPDAIYIAQVKRLHEYKRQLMTAFAVLRIYYDLKAGKLPDFSPTVFLFGAKAASGYRRAKAIIKYLNAVAETINVDEAVRGKLQVVFVQNYDVSYAEKIVAGSDVSLQVSTAGFEASGTGNMKLMMNGAVTVGTMDGANIEIAERAGLNNNYIFGATVTELGRIRNDYNPSEIVQNKPAVKRVTDTLVNGTFSDGGTGGFAELHAALFEGASWHKPDHYFVVYDLESYVQALLAVNRDYRNAESFSRKQLMNALHSAFFSSDRAVKTYANLVWGLDRPQ